MNSALEASTVQWSAASPRVGFATACSIVIANIIGTGIFTSLGFAAPVALAAMAFGKYLHGVLQFGSPVIFSFAVVWLVTLFHLKTLQIGSVFHNFSTVIKLLLIAALIVTGIFVHPKQPINFLPARGATTSIFGAGFAVALVYVMYSYSGWNAAVYIAGEIKQPEKNVPRSLLAGTIVVIVAYVLLNAIFLATTPVQELKGQLEVALIAGKHMFRENGGRVGGAEVW